MKTSVSQNVKILYLSQENYYIRTLNQDSIFILRCCLIGLFQKRSTRPKIPAVQRGRGGKFVYQGHQKEGLLSIFSVGEVWMFSGMTHYIMVFSELLQGYGFCKTGTLARFQVSHSRCSGLTSCQLQASLMASCITIPLKFCIPIPIKLSRIPPLAKFLFQCIELQHSFLAAMIENTTEIYLGSHPSLLSQRTSAFLDFLSLWNANKSV